ncbi:uncharacterized protein LOC119988344 [Tripterygium wilfordii]|uniref:uncharacterized protein LOC119988344 n=1 Tax=Tripterygium wilfordii TaxID=458696 RepID=UPI0018F8610E|nr:uncharacterized protein LOC119988344 [Tripterygium wilfordii]
MQATNDGKRKLRRTRNMPSSVNMASRIRRTLNSVLLEHMLLVQRDWHRLVDTYQLQNTIVVMVIRVPNLTMIWILGLEKDMCLSYPTHPKIHPTHTLIHPMEYTLENHLKSY